MDLPRFIQHLLKMWPHLQNQKNESSTLIEIISAIKLYHMLHWTCDKTLQFQKNSEKLLLIHAQAQTKHKLEKWFIISGDGVRPYICTYVRTYKTKQTDQRLNHFSS